MDPYLVVIAALLVAAVLVRVVVFRRPAAVELDPVAAGYLAAGSLRAVQTAVGMLRLDGAVSVATVGKIKRIGGRPGDLGRLPAAIFDAVERAAVVQTVRREPAVRAALRETRDRLVAAYLYFGAGWRTVLGVLAGAVLVVGMARPVEQPLGWRNLAIVVASTAAAVALWRSARRTRTGTRTLRALRDRHPVTDDGGGMMVALYGRLDLAGIENITARPRRRRKDTGYSDRGHYMTGGIPGGTSGWADGGGSSF